MLQTAHINRIVSENQTDVVLQVFADRIIILVTQLGKVGNLVRIYDLRISHSATTHELKVLKDTSDDPFNHPSPTCATPRHVRSEL